MAAISVTDAATLLLDHNPARRGAVIQNNSGETVFVDFGVAATVEGGVLIQPGANLTLGETAGPVSAIAETGPAELRVIQELL